VTESAVSIVIVSWNVRELLLGCLASIDASAGTLPHDICVVDNASTDGTVDAIRLARPDVSIVANDANVGFSRANNQGIARARGRYVLLQNPDTLWIDESLARLVAFMDSHPDVGAVGPKLLNGDRRTVQFEGARRLPRPVDTFCEYTRLTAIFRRARWAKRHLISEWDHLDSRRVDCLSGACLLIRREVLSEIGTLDEAYPFNVEDVDWCRRVGLSRWTLHYLAEAQLVHFGRQSIVNNRGVAALGAMRGVYYYYGKFDGRATALAVWALLFPISCIKLLVWAAVYVVRPERRAFARQQAATFWQICRLSPWPARSRA
jgi:GT2 family glycosyltransferase